MQTNNNHFNDSLPEGDQKARAERAFWSMLGLLYRRRRFIVGVTGGVAVLAVVISLLLPNWYQASTRLLPPEGGGTSPIASFMSKNISSSVASLLGGGSGDYMRYSAILSSRSMYESVVDSFDLVTVYDLEDSEAPREAAIATFSDYVDFPIDDEYEFLSVSVMDRDPQRAAAIANFMVRELNRRNQALSAQNASHFRRFVEKRYREAEAALDTLKNAVQTFQKRYGVYDLESQATTFLEQAAELRGEAMQLEIQYEALLDQYGPDNPQVRMARQGARSANQKYQAALRGREAVLPVAQDDVPDVLRQYVDLEQERLIQERTLEVVAPLYEQARFDEEREFESVQVVDYAVPPVKKAWPRRSVICITATLSAFVLSLLFVLLWGWWSRNHAYYSRRMQQAAFEAEPEVLPESKKEHV